MITEDGVVIVKKIINVPIEDVFRAWTDPSELEQWKSPEGMTTPIAEVDLKVGGKWHVRMESKKGDGKHEAGIYDVRGTYRAIEKNKKLVFTWKWDWDKSDSESIVSVQLKKLADNKTEVILMHEGVVGKDQINDHNMGWKSTFRKLSKFLEGGD